MVKNLIFLFKINSFLLSSNNWVHKLSKTTFERFLGEKIAELFDISSRKVDVYLELLLEMLAVHIEYIWNKPTDQ